MNFLTPINLNQNEFRNAQLQNLATAPSSPVVGQMYFDTVKGQAGFYTGSRWLYVADTYVTSVAADGTTILNTGTSTAPILGVGVIPESKVTGLVADLASKASAALIGSVNGIATLDGSGHVPTSQLPSSVIGGLNYQGAWNASTNSPTLTSSTGTKGFLYKVSVAGTSTLDGISVWNAGDEVVFDGTTWDKIDGGNYVSSVNGRIGVITLSGSDVPAFVASGSGHAAGVVPDPGASAGAVKYLREDATWVVPPDTNSGGTVKKFASNIGAITGGTPIALAHGLATADATWNVVDASGNSVYPDVKIDSTNVTLSFSASVAANTYRVIVTG